MSTDIHPRLNEILQNNVGNKLTPELAAGVVGTLQQLMNNIAQEAFVAGQASEREKADAAAAAPAEPADAAGVTDVEAKPVS
ncbi:hypothetical protein CTTA_3476 [Comamonas testosteroni]|uniref:Uncharacterized protein n=1 Tax=Comamonas testosteroni TaxID=285 RepID=A0A5A7MHP2_COMTE|nr:hypothetical protein [Comamonas testosteroni]GEQ76471.1 hypothetical protein CTTA_3476 [Comamonas testosteroni]